MTPARRNRRTAAGRCACVIVGHGRRSPRPRCRSTTCSASVTGFGGTPRIDADAARAAAAGAARSRCCSTPMSTRICPGRSSRCSGRDACRSGEETLAFYEAVNRADQPVVGRAVYNVTPFKVGSYFSKVHCFCFEEQTLAAGPAGRHAGVVLRRSGACSTIRTRARSSRSPCPTPSSSIRRRRPAARAGGRRLDQLRLIRRARDPPRGSGEQVHGEHQPSPTTQHGPRRATGTTSPAIPTTSSTPAPGRWSAACRPCCSPAAA